MRLKVNVHLITMCVLNNKTLRHHCFHTANLTKHHSQTTIAIEVHYFVLYRFYHGQHQLHIIIYLANYAMYGKESSEAVSLSCICHHHPYYHCKFRRIYRQTRLFVGILCEPIRNHIKFNE